MATAVAEFAFIFRQLGIGAVIIQRKNLTPNLISSLFTLTVIMGAVLMALSIGVSPLIAKLFKNPDVQPVLSVLSISFLFGSFGVVPRSLLNRDMKFNRLVQVELVSAIIQTCSAVILAYIGWGVWALVGSMIITSIVYSLLMRLAAKWKFSFSFYWHEVKEVMGFALNVTGNSLMKCIHQ